MPTTKSSLAVFLVLILFLSQSTSCLRKLDRTTTVSGRVINEARQPVDSILVIMASAGLSKAGISLAETYTDKDGNYSIILDVPKGYGAVTVAIPFDHNNKFTNIYKEYLVYQDNQRTVNCCAAAIGRKTNFDFLLLNK
jgi:hypothetical protein